MRGLGARRCIRLFIKANKNAITNVNKWRACTSPSASSSSLSYQAISSRGVQFGILLLSNVLEYFPDDRLKLVDSQICIALGMFVGIMVATQEDVDYMNGCGTLVTTSWMWIRECHTVGLCLETLYIRGLSLYCLSSIGIDWLSVAYIVISPVMDFLVWFNPPWLLHWSHVALGLVAVISFSFLSWYQSWSSGKLR